MAHSQTEPFDWGLAADRFELSGAQARLCDEAAQFDIRCGFTIPIQDGWSFGRQRGPEIE